jgi:hypothetical protein
MQQIPFCNIYSLRVSHTWTILRGDRSSCPRRSRPAQTQLSFPKVAVNLSENLNKRWKKSLCSTNLKYNYHPHRNLVWTIKTISRWPLQRVTWANLGHSRRHRGLWQRKTPTSQYCSMILCSAQWNATLRTRLGRNHKTLTFPYALEVKFSRKSRSLKPWSGVGQMVSARHPGEVICRWFPSVFMMMAR